MEQCNQEQTGRKIDAWCEAIFAHVAHDRCHKTISLTIAMATS